MAKKNRQARLDEMAARKQQAQPVQQEVPAPKEEAAPAKEAAPAVVPRKEEDPKVDFDAWFAMRGAKIPRHHHKEVVKADFKGRGLGQYESLADFDQALKEYGINLA